jgi:hypothetical protein
LSANIVPSRWGKDHWSTFAYAAYRAYNYKGVLNFEQMRRDGDAYPTRLKDGEVKGHNDYDCLWDMERYGFIENHGSGLNPVIKLTEKGLEAYRQLMAYKQNGGNYQDFEFKEPDVVISHDSTVG